MNDTVRPYQTVWGAFAGAFLAACAAALLGLAQPAHAGTLTPSPSPMAFGNVVVGIAGNAVVVLQNSGSDTTITGLSVAGGDSVQFSANSGCGELPVTLAAADSCNVDVSFQPTSLGAKSTTLLVSISGGSPVEVDLGGTGISGTPDIQVSPLSLPFGSRPVGVASALIVTVSNTGTGALSFAASESAADFSLSSAQCNPGGDVLAPSASCEISVSFTPQALGLRSGTLMVESNDADESLVNVPLSGTGIPGTRGDFNADGNADILWRNVATGENYLYPMNGTGILGTEGYLRTVADMNWNVVGTGDFDGDGKADVLWRNASTGENYVYLMDGTVISGEGYIRTVADQNWQVAGAGDLDGDGKADILWRNAATGENYVYPMDGLAIKATEGYVRTVANLDWNVVGTGDMDGDGKADVLWRNGATGENYLYPMDGTTIKPAEGFLRTVPDQNWRVAGVGDFDGDGNADVLWRNVATGENYLYPMDGTTILGTEGYLRTVPDLYWQVKGTGDYDGDGSADILWRNGATGENYLYPMNGTTIKPTEGYLRTVADESWRIPVRDYAGEPLELAGITALHNQVRAAVETGTPLAALQWESALAATARSWAATCDFSHNPSRSVGHPYVVGENIYGSSAAATAQAAVSLWAAEEQYYDYSTNSCTAGQTCGHYTQLVWRTTLRLGCALQDCEGSTPRYRIVCNYGPGGNSIGLPY